MPNWEVGTKKEKVMIRESSKKGNTERGDGIEKESSRIMLVWRIGW